MTKYTVIVKSDKLKDVIPIPSEFEHKDVEVSISLARKKKFDPKKYRGIGKASKESIDSYLKSVRSEWDRDGE